MSTAETLVSLLVEGAEARGDALAYRFLATGEVEGPHEERSYRAIGERARAIGAWLQAEAKPGDRAVLLYAPGLDFIEGFFGAQHGGVIPVPAYPPDLSRLARSLPRLRAILADCQATFVLTTRPLLDLAEGLFALSPELAAPRWVATDEISTGLAPRWRDPGLVGEDIAFLQYTSGSTGAPKGVMVTHRNLLANLEISRGNAQQNAEPIRMVSWLPPYHDLGLIGAILMPLYARGECTLFSPLDFLARPARWVEAVSRFRANVSGGPNFAYDLCARKTPEEVRRGLDLSSWEVAFNGAEPIRAETLARFSDVFAESGFSARAHCPGYGLAEATLTVTGARPRHGARASSFDPAALALGQAVERPGGRVLTSCGFVLGAQQVVIVDPETREPLPAGQIGELWIAGASVAPGYWQQPARNQEIFGARLASGDGPYLRSGDLGFFHQGELYLSGRQKDLLIIRGRNHFPNDIERTVEQAHPAIRPGCAAAFSVDHHGEEALGVVAEVDPRKCSDPEEVFSALRRAIGDAHEIALAAAWLLAPGSIAKTSSGKLQRYAMRAAALDGSLEHLHAWRAPVEAVAPVAPAPLPGLRAISGLPSEPGSSERADAALAWLRGYAPRRLSSLLGDARRSTAPHVVVDLGERGFFGLQAPTRVGGLALSHADVIRLTEQVAAIDIGLAIILGSHNSLGLRAILRHAQEPLREALVPRLASGRMLASFAFTEPGAGANPRAIATTAVPEGEGAWRLYGEKQWIGNAAWAGALVVFAYRLDAQGSPLGISGFVVPEDAPGLRIGPEAMTMGLRGSVQSRVFLDGVRVTREQLLGDESLDLDVADDAMTFSRWGLGVVSLGAMKRSAQLIARYAERRTIATGLLREHPATRARLHDLTAAIAAGERFLRRVAELLDQGEEVPVEVFAACKILLPELAWEAADGLMQLLGGRGYMESSGVPQLFRDLRMLRIAEGPTEAIQSYLGARAQRAWPALVQGLAQLGAPASLIEALREQLSALAARWEAVEPIERARAVAFHAGPLAAWALLEASSTTAPAWVKGWIHTRRERAIQDALASAPPPPADELAARVRAYEEAISDLDPNQAAEEWSLDPLLRRELHAVPAARQAPALAVRTSTDAGAPDLERFITAWIERALKLPAGSVQRETPLSQYGIDSVSAVELAHALEARLGRPVNPSLAWRYPTARALALHLSQAPGVEAPRLSVVPAPPQEAYALSVGEADLLRLIARQPSQESYNLFFPLRAHEPLDPEALRVAFRGLLQRQDNLRTAFFFREDGSAARRVYEAVPFSLEVDDLAALSGEAREEAVHAACRELRLRRFALEHPPALAAKLLQCGPDESLLLLAVSHLVTDAWGLGVLHRELAARYEAALRGEDASIPPLGLRALDYAEANHAAFGALAARGPSAFAPYPAEDFSIPLDQARPEAPSSLGSRHLFLIEAELRDRVQGAAQQHGASLAVACLVAFQVALHRVTQREEVLFAVVQGNRRLQPLREVIGYFVYAEMFAGALGQRRFTDLLSEALLFSVEDRPSELPRALVRMPPGVRVLFNFNNAPIWTGQAPRFLPAPELSRFPYLWETHDILWQLFPTPQGLLCSALYRHEIYREETLLSLADAFTTALQEIASDPTQLVSLSPR